MTPTVTVALAGWRVIAAAEVAGASSGRRTR
ncbi:MAG: hypothetical protein QOI15_3071 [Pseudonocardiales bacterium]|nr:hypothetical protein [Pseudonocardiales bacterium]